MKQITIFVTTATALLGMLTACSMGNDNKGEAVQADTIASDAFTPEAAVAHYLADSIGQYYSPGDLCIPSITVIDLDSSSAQDIKLWGDFWVFNYKQEGDTLMCVSGGSHPGLMHLRQAGDTYEVTAFDPILDGSQFLPSAHEIFGDRFDNFLKVNSDEKTREATRRKAIIDYAKQHDITATYYKDYGWPAKAIFDQ